MKMYVLKSIGEQSMESVESVLQKKKATRAGFVEKDVWNLEWKSDGVMDDESGESIEEKVPVIWTGELESWRLVRGWQREAGSWFQMRWSILKGTICYLQRRWCWWTNQCDQRWRTSTVRRLNGDEFMQIWRLSGCENFVCEWKDEILFDNCNL